MDENKVLLRYISIFRIHLINDNVAVEGSEKHI